MAELRWNPILKDWVMNVSSRQKRPNMPKDFCPFCPGSGKVPDNYEVLKYDNDFPALSANPPEPDDVANELYKTAPLRGKCEVILYSPNHTQTLPELSAPHVRKLVDLWCERFEEIAKDPEVKYILIFENRGELVGVTMPHPHGQIYGYPWIPKKLQVELDSSAEYYAETGKCLYCDMLSGETADGRRIIFENEHFITYLPYYAEFVYGVCIAAKNHVSCLSEFSDEMKTSLANAVRDTAATLDALFDKPMPYMMAMHQSPVNGDDRSKDYHFHIEFYPPLRSETQIQWRASSETAAWACCNPTCPEEKAQELREAYTRMLSARKEDK